MTGGAVAAGGEVLAVGAVGRNQAAVRIMTRGTGVMDLGISRIGEQRRIAVTARTAGRIDLDQRVVSRRAVVGREVRGLPTRGMTGGAVAARQEGFRVGAKSRHQGAVAVMAVRAIGQMR